MERIKSESEILRDKRLELFNKNKSLIMANEERIFSDKRLGCVQVPIFLPSRIGTMRHCSLRNYLRMRRICSHVDGHSAFYTLFYMHRYYGDISWSVEEPYTLEEAIEILKREPDEETFAKNIEKCKQQQQNRCGYFHYLHLDRPINPILD